MLVPEGNGVKGRRGRWNLLDEAVMEDSRRIDVRLGRRSFLTAAAAAVASPTIQAATGDALARARSTRRRARLAERKRGDECVRLHYEAAVFAYAALAADPRSSAATAVYNDSLADCLSAAGRHRLIDPRSQLLVPGPGGATVVPIVHQGFVWSPIDFHELLDPATAPRNLSNRHDHSRGGLGATRVVVRRNLRQDPCDAFLHDPTHFPATAVLRPDLDSWLNGGGPGGDVLEFYDPLRVRSVALPGGAAPLASDVDSPTSFLAWSSSDGESGWAGLLNPSQDVNRAFLGLIEPFQPGKIPVFFVHGMFDSPFTFSDLMNGLRLRPGFLDRYQIVGYRYATGMTFLHSAAQFRERLHAFQAAFDPWSNDPGVQDSVFVGHSLGGLLIKLQLVSSGEAFWNLVSNRPLESLAVSDRARASLDSLFRFDPVPFARRAVFMATPHGGLSTAGKTGEMLNELANRPPRDLDPLVAEVSAADPGAFRPYIHELPSGVGVLRGRDPIHETLRDLPIASHVRYHSVAGAGRVIPPAVAHGDGVVPIASTVIDGAESQTLIPEWHTTMNYSEYALVEVDRILKAHLAG